ncbi:MAG: transketolase [Bacteroidota bacterium]|nr:transketolase [Bacteroidota bacterium]
MTTNSKSIDVKAADNIRVLSAAMVEKSKSGHPGGAMGGAEFMHVLFTEFLRFDPTDMSWPFRDRFFLDPGHMSPLLYSTLSLFDFFTLEDLQNFRQWHSNTPGHPERNISRGIENTSGPLGMGHTMAVGAAIAERYLATRFGEWSTHKTYAYISDGGIQEEISQGAGRLAGHLGLSNLIMFYDSNDIQLSSATKVVTSEDTAMKYKAWGWNVMTIDGNDVAQIREALKKAQTETERPTIIIGKTVMGKGAVKEDGSSFESQISTHGQPLSKAGASIRKTIENLGGNPDSPFEFFADVKQVYNDARKAKVAAAAKAKANEQQWAAENPELAATLASYLSGDAPKVDYAAIEHKKNTSTRQASGDVLAAFVKQVPNMVVISADLSNSDKTDEFLKRTTPFAKNDFSGSFLQAGVSELTMAGIANGLALHGGIIPACGTFFVFSDYMKPAVRLAALMELPVKYIWTHDSFRVGEDGPTHQPVEQEAQIRLMEQLRNHSGGRSVLVLRPGDAPETSVAWKMAMENTNTPTALLLSRQNITDLPSTNGSRYADALQSAKGAYVVKEVAGKPDLLMIANGSEVATLVAGAELLEKDKGLKTRVISIPSLGLYYDQPEAYRKELIPAGIPILGLTAGLPSVLQGVVGCSGVVLGLDSFGYSAPAEVLDEKLGYTAEHVYEEALKLVK